MDSATPLKAAQKPSSKRAFFAFFLAAFSCLLGLSFCLVKSPQARAQAYVAAALEAMEDHRPHQAAAAALEAVRLDPMLPQGWRILSEMLQQKGDVAAAAQARSIAARVQHKPVDAVPVYAAAADLRLGLLALADPQVP
jgi:cytochrome c-type biogenesis protein CcmH/NrfG